jgi:phenylpropionate dioxygenase-like ring-hydroxylating dioxygenase large terminal subunit
MTTTPTRPQVSHVGGIAEIVEQVAASAGDVAEAISLPPATYISPSFYDFERSAVFARNWLYVCHISSVAHPGDFVSLTVAGEPLIITRSSDGSVRALSGLCRHRSYPLLDANETGNATTLRCPYHFWSYGMDGSLATAPNMEPAHTLRELRDSICLPSFPVEIWNGFVFTHLGTDPEPLAPTLARLDEECVAHRTAELVIGDSVVLTGLPFNWKNMLENALEAYHTSFLHRGYHDSAPARLVQFLGFDEQTENGIMRYAPFLQEGGGFLNKDGKAAFPLIEGMTRDQRSRIVFASAPPTMFISMKPDSVMVFRITPESHDRMTLAVDWLFPQSSIEREDFPELMARQREFFEIVNGQDMVANERMYNGLKAANACRGPYSPQEATLPQLNGWLLRSYRAGLAEGPAAQGFSQ